MMKLQTLMELKSLEKEELSPVANHIEMVSIYLDIDTQEVRDFPIKKLRENVIKIEKDLKTQSKRVDSIELDDTQLQLISFDKLNLGEYIDCDQYLLDGDYGKLLSVLFREHYPVKNIDNLNIEPYKKINVNVRSKMIEQLPANGLSVIIREFVEFRENLIETYNSLFDPKNEEIEDEDENALTESELKMRAAAALHAEFGWEAFIMFLGNDDVTKWEEVCSLPLFFALNMASYKKSLIPNR